MSAKNAELLPTVKTRLDIGMRDLQSRWHVADATYSARGLEILGHPVMEYWEDSYMHELAKVVTRHGGRILEVGFGLGLSAHHIQSFDVDEHVIIEANINVFNNLMNFKKKYNKKIVPIFGLWQDCVGILGEESFDGILFDTYPLTEEEVHKNHFPFLGTAHRLLKKNRILTYYSDEAEEFSDSHMEKLKGANFTKISRYVIEVDPPSDCKYWNKNTLVVPIIYK